jgi:hypothetical protein
MADYSKAFSPSFSTQTFTTQTIPGINYKASSNFNLSNIDFKKASTLNFNPLAFSLGESLLNPSANPGWTFITSPEEISWDVSNQVDRVSIFGTNTPPVISGSRGMRDLKLGNSLVEGFVRNVTVETKIASLENLLNYRLSPTDGYVSVPVYQVWANQKSYGNGFFIIKDIRIQEKMRDLRGDATRAYVDISMIEVPEYQVNTGRDQASSVTTGAKSALLSNAQARAQGGVTTPQQAAAAQINQKNSAATTSPSGAGSAKPAAVNGTLGRQYGVAAPLQQ